MTTNEYRELLLGCGNSREKRVIPGELGEFNPQLREWQNLTTLDIDPDCEPDIVFDLCRLEWQGIPRDRHRTEEMPPNTFNEIHAYEVLEHVGEQGHYKLFFAQFREFWRVLKPDGYFCATVPDYRSVWAWGDPSHTRVINMGTLVFLSKAQYAQQVGKTAMSDFRSIMGDMDFSIIRARVTGEQMEFVLRAIK